MKKKYMDGNEWIATNPEHKHLADQAVEVLLLLRSAKENKITEQEIRAAVANPVKSLRTE